MDRDGKRRRRRRPCVRAERVISYLVLYFIWTPFHTARRSPPCIASPNFRTWPVRRRDPSSDVRNVFILVFNSTRCNTRASRINKWYRAGPKFRNNSRAKVKHNVLPPPPHVLLLKTKNYAPSSVKRLNGSHTPGIERWGLSWQHLCNTSVEVARISSWIPFFQLGDRCWRPSAVHFAL